MWVTAPLAGEPRLYVPNGKLLRSVGNSAPEHPLQRPAVIAMAPGRGALVVSDFGDGLIVVLLGKASLPALAIGGAVQKPLEPLSNRPCNAGFDRPESMSGGAHGTTFCGRLARSVSWT